MSRNGNKQIKYGLQFDSKLELERFEELRLLERSGEIRNLRHHIKIPLVPESTGRELIDQNERPITYNCDYTYHQTIDGVERIVIEEIKGNDKDAEFRYWALKRKLLKQKYPEIVVKEIIGGIDETQRKINEQKLKRQKRHTRRNAK